MPQLTTCPSCADRLDPEDRFCGNCGARVTPEPDGAGLPADAPARPAADYGLAPPAGAPGPLPRQGPARPDGSPCPAGAAAPRPGITDPRQRMLRDEPGPPPEHAPAPDPRRTAAVPGPSPAPGVTAPAGDADAAGRVGAAEHPAGPDPAARPPRADAAPAAAPAPEASDAPAVPPAPPAPPAPAAAPEAGDPAGDTGVGCPVCRDGAVDGPLDGERRCTGCGHYRPRARDHVEHAGAGVAAVSDRGLRHQRNEDDAAIGRAVLPDGGTALLAVVCDGVSSATRPDEASRAAAGTGRATLEAALSAGEDQREAMHRALLAAAAAVSALCPPKAAEDPHFNAPACTCVSAVVAGDLLTVGWIGDSRAYWIPDNREDQPARLTEDDSWAARMVEAGLMSEAEAYADPRAHAITGWLGADAEDLDPHTASFQLDRPGVVVVCTDGLWNYAESAALLASVVPPDARTDPLGCARSLVGTALDGGGHDNVTVAVLPFPVPEQQAEAVPEAGAGPAA